MSSTTKTGWGRWIRPDDDDSTQADAPTVDGDDHRTDAYEDWDSDGYGYSYSRGSYGYGSGYSTYSMKKVRRTLQPLFERLEAYDDARLVLEREGGQVDDLRKVTALLTEPMRIRAGYRPKKVVLAQPESVKEVVRSLGRYDIRWQVRTRPSGMPVYYVCRVRTDYWTDYKLVVEDLYVSPGYPMGDGRFIQLMHMGHEQYHLRMSPFRELATELVGGDRKEVDVDSLLQKVGQNVLQAAWHEDQRLGLAAAEHFDMPWFAHAIELLYLCLSAELCELRASLTPEMIRFFSEVYPQPAIHAFLLRLTEVDGATLDDLPDRAYSLYHDLARSFGVFLSKEPEYGYSDGATPLYKVLFANVDRVGEAAEPLLPLPEVAEGATELTAAAQQISDQLISMDRQDPASLPTLH